MKDFINAPNLDEKVVKVINYGEGDILPQATVIIVTFNSNEKLLDLCLEALTKQTFMDFEIFIVDNSNKTDMTQIISKYKLKYIKLSANYGLSLGRNVGIKYARSEIVIFLDDDAIPARNFVEKHLTPYTNSNIIGLRGKAFPITSTIFNYMLGNYDLGDQLIPSIIDLEGNSSFKRDNLIDIGGFNPIIDKRGGFEGTELTYRIIKKYNDKSRLVYSPDAIIYHDKFVSLLKYIKSLYRYRKRRLRLQRQMPVIFEFALEYNRKPAPNRKDRLDLTIKLRLAILNMFKFILYSLAGIGEA